MDDRGRIANGLLADFVVFDDELKVLDVIKSGKPVDAYITHELIHVRQRAIIDESNSLIAKALKESETIMLSDPLYYQDNEVHDSYMMEYNANFDGFYETYMYLDFIDSKYKMILLKDFIKIAVNNQKDGEYNIHYGI